MSDMSKINMIHVLGMCGMSEKDNPDAQTNVLGKCKTFRASVGCPQVNWGLSEINMPLTCTNVMHVPGMCGISKKTTAVSR